MIYDPRHLFKLVLILPSKIHKVSSVTTIVKEFNVVPPHKHTKCVAQFGQHFPAAETARSNNTSCVQSGVSGSIISFSRAAHHSRSFDTPQKQPKKTAQGSAKQKKQRDS